MNQKVVAGVVLSLMLGTPAGAADIVRRQAGDFAIASSVRVPAGALVEIEVIAARRP